MNQEEAKKKAVNYLISDLSPAHFEGGANSPEHRQFYGLKKAFMNKGKLGLHGIAKVMDKLGYEINFTKKAN